MRNIRTCIACMTATLALSLASCSNHDDIEVSGDGTVSVEIRLTVSIDPKVITPTGSRANALNEPRMIVDWQGAQNVNDVRIYVFGSQTPDGRYLYIGGGEMPDGSYLVGEFNNSGVYNGSDADDKAYNENYEAHEFAFKPRLAPGRYYKFLAVGRDDRLGKDIPTSIISYVPWGTRTLDEPHLLVGVTEIHDVVVNNLLTITKYPYVCTEIFSGMMMSKDASGRDIEDYVYVTERVPGFDKTIELKRAVAGLYAYITDIPTKAVDNSGNPMFDGLEFEPDEVTVYMTYSTSSLNLTTFPYMGGNVLHNIQVGYVDLRNYYGETNDKAPWYKVPGDKYWHRDAIEDYHGAHIDANSLLMTNFLIPFDPTELLADGESTFTVQLRQQESDYTLTKQVKCKIVTLQDPATGQPVTSDYDPLRFPVEPNMLYTLGSPSNPLRLGSVIK